jgi:hypothetical protein
MTTRAMKEALPGRLWWTRWPGSPTASPHQDREEPALSERVLAECLNSFLDDLYEPRRRQTLKSLRAPNVV